MSRRYERDEREYWRRQQQQNRQDRNRWSTGRHDDDYGWEGRNQEGRNWLDWEYGLRSGRNREMWEGTGQERGNWQENRDWDRMNPGWQGRGYPNRSEGEYGMESRYGRSDWNR